MRQALDQFHDNLVQLGHLQLVYDGLQSQTTSILDLSDVLRSRLVLTVSAFDLFIHEIVRLGMLECYYGHRAATPSFLAFKIPISNVLNAISSPTLSHWLEDEIRLQHGYKAFQHSDKVAEAIRMISTVKLWDEVSLRTAQPASSVKSTLNLIMDRRNKIVHEADCIPSTPGSRWPISIADVENANSFLSQVAEAIFLVI